MDTVVQWLKVQNECGKSYFILWDQHPAFPAIDVLSVIPADPSELASLNVPLAAGELPWLEKGEIATSVIRDRELTALWRAERRKLEKAGDLDPLPIPLKTGRRRKRRTGDSEPGVASDEAAGA